MATHSQSYHSLCVVSFGDEIVRQPVVGNLSKEFNIA